MVIVIPMVNIGIKVMVIVRNMVSIGIRIRVIVRTREVLLLGKGLLKGLVLVIV